VSRPAQVVTGLAERAKPRRKEAPADDRIGIVPILWNNADLPDLAPPVPAMTVLDEIARLGYSGTQLGIGFPKGRELAAALASRRLRLAEVYVALPCDASGPAPAAVEVARAGLEELDAAGGDVLVVALALSPERDAWVGRAQRAPGLTDEGWRSLGACLNDLAAEASQRGHGLAFHNHAATYVETPEEVDRLCRATSSERVGLCLDVGHATLGGGDAAAMIHRYSERITHFHLKDVDAETLEDMRSGRVTGFEAALRARVFVPLGSGVLDLPAVLDALSEAGYEGWIMVEQDTSWDPPSEAAAVGRSVLAAMLRWRAGAPGGRP
jgi:inosose dehydratase